MKRIKYLFLTALVVFNTNCAGFLDTEPSNSVLTEDIFTSVKGADAAYNGAFKTIMEWFSTYAFPGYRSIQIISDVTADDITPFSTYGSPTTQYKMLVTNNYTSGTSNIIWAQMYKTIDQCNTIIENLKAKEDEEYKEILGQAYFLRAFCYFDLVRLYQFTYSINKDELVCPIYTNPIKITDEGNPLSSISEVYDLILNDLNESEGLLKDFVRVDKDRPDASVVYGLKARVYLTMENWSEAEINAKKARDGYSLMTATDFASGFNDRANSEWIYMFGQSSDQSSMSYAFHYLDNNAAPNGSAYYSSMRPDPYWVQLLEEDDIRRKDLISWDALGKPKGYIQYQKFRFKSPTNLIGDFVLMRSAEMYLIEAEAAARNTSRPITDAETIINELRLSRNASLFTGSTRDGLINEILLERRRELWGEGFSIYDVLRTQRTIVRKEVTLASGEYDPEILKGMEIPVIDGTPIKIYGHSVLKQPNGTDFVANSPYYIFVIPEKEVINNPNIDKPE